MFDPRYDPPQIEVYPGHVIPWNAVVLSFKDRDDPGCCYHFMSAANALELLAQLEAAKPALLDMATNKEVRDSGETPTRNFDIGGS